MANRVVKRVETSKLFWKDLEEWRRHPDYKKIRREINDMLKRMSAGENAGERGFNNSVWEDIKHKHVSAKLVVFVR